MITGIILENFKCFRKVEVNPRLITVFVGPNGSGKSSVLQAMALLKQSAGSGAPKFKGSLVDLGDFREVKPNFDDDFPKLHMGFAGRNQVARPGSEGIGERVAFWYHTDLDTRGTPGHWGNLSFTFEATPHEIAFERSNDEENVFALPEVKIRIRRPGAVGHIADRVAVVDGSGPLLDAVVRHIFQAPARLLEHLKLVLAARGLVRTRYPLRDQAEDEISILNGLGSLEEQISSNLAYSRDSEAKVSDWLGKITGVGLRGKPVPPSSVAVESMTPRGSVNIVAEGFGTNALALLLLELARASAGATVMIEEPEIHLHPRAQADLASLLADVAKDEDKQLIMTTHSEHIVGPLLTLVAEKKLSRDDLAVYAFEKAEDGECTASELEITEDGRVKGGIKDFFEPNLDELDRYVRALQPSE